MGANQKPRTTHPKKQPALYIPHGGGPCFFMDWSPIGPKDTWEKMANWMKGIPATLPETPRAIVLISAHWEESEFTILNAPNPELFFDYSGFPKHTYELTYPARVEVELSRKIESLLRAADLPVRMDGKRGFDHGVFIPLKVIFPDANIPIVQISLKRNLSPRDHLKLGQVLGSLREEGVLVIGSGMSYHNLRELFSGRNVDHSKEFDDWLTDTLEVTDPESREKKLLDWENAPSARRAHPREEHFIPVFTILGAAGKDKGKRVFSDRVMGAITSAYQFG